MEILEFILKLVLGVGGILGVGWLGRLITLREFKKEAQGKNRDQAIASLEKVIESLTADGARKDDTIANLSAKLEAERAAHEAVRNENTAVKFVMCVHMGCIGRLPGAGQGDLWYDEHKGDPYLGADYLPINRIMLAATASDKAARKRLSEQVGKDAGEGSAPGVEASEA